LIKNKTILEQIISNWSAKALSLAAAIMLFLFHNFSSLSERFLSVELNAVFADGYTTAQPYPRRVRVEIRGTDRSLAAAGEEDIEAVVDFSRFKEEGVHTTPISITKKGALEGIDTIEILVEPLELTLPLEKKVRKRVSVVPVFKGIPSPGFRMDQYSLSPSRVDMEGPGGVVQHIQSVTTEDIDLSGKREPFSARVRLVNDNPLLTFPDGGVIDFRGQILESLDMKTFEEIPITLEGVAQGLAVRSDGRKGWIIVQGGLNNLDGVKKEDLTLVADCSGITEPGPHVAPVRPIVPPGLTVVQYDPVSVYVTVRKDVARYR
jgi:YbbR domain-containing protein